MHQQITFRSPTGRPQPSRFVPAAPDAGRRATRLRVAHGSAACCLALALITADVVRGQQPASDTQLFEEAVEVRVVEIEVWVQKKNGESVTDLQAEDFRLLVDGKEQEIEYFEQAEGASSAGGEPESVLPADERKPSYLAVYLDRHFLEEGDFNKLRRDLADFLRTSLKPEDHVLLATANEELEVLESFTPDRERVIHKLNQLKGAPDGGKLAGDFRSMMRDLRSEQNARSTLSVSIGRNPTEDRFIRKQSPESYLREIDAYHRETAGELRLVAEQLLELISTLSGLPGNKQVLYVGGPLPTDGAKILFETWRDVFERNQKQDDFLGANPTEVLRAQRAALEMIGRHGGFRVGSDMFREVGTAASVSGVTFHTLGLASLRRSRNVLASRMDVEVGTIGRGVASEGITDIRASLAMDDGLQALALLTGGRHLRGRSKFTRFFERLGTDLRSRYVLGFSGSPETESAPREVEVKLRDGKLARGHLVRHRGRFVVKSREVELAERTLAALMMDETKDNPLGLELGVRVPEARAEGWVIEVAVRVPTSRLTLVPDRETHFGQMTIFATAGRLGSDFSPVMKTKVPLRFADKDLPIALNQKLEYVLQLHTTQDPGQVSITVRDELGPTESTVKQEIRLLSEPSEPGAVTTGLDS